MPLGPKQATPHPPTRCHASVLHPSISPPPPSIQPASLLSLHLRTLFYPSVLHPSLRSGVPGVTQLDSEDTETRKPTLWRHTRKSHARIITMKLGDVAQFTVTRQKSWVWLHTGAWPRTPPARRQRGAQHLSLACPSRVITSIKGLGIACFSCGRPGPS